MSVKFNEVTWYSKVATLIVLIAAIILWWNIGMQYREISRIRESTEQIQKTPTSTPATIPTSTPSKPIAKSGNVAVSINKPATFSGLQISLERIEQDSRCPVDVVCIRAGDITALVNLRAANKSEKVSMISNGQEYRFANYVIRIADVAPAHHSQIETKQSEYVVTFHVTNTSVKL